jgi:hypothetical protein
MPKSKKGELAKKNFQSVKYFPFGNQPASSYVLTTNPFSFLNSWLDNEIDKVIKETKDKRRSKLEKAKYFCLLAEDFNNSAQSSRMPAKATMLYYAQLNLVKCFLLLNGFELEKTIEKHGLNLPYNSELILRVMKKESGSILIFREFARLTGVDVNKIEGSNFDLRTLLFELPEIHELGFALEIFDGKRRFLPVEIEIKINEGHTSLYYEIIYNKKHSSSVDSSNFFKNVLKPNNEEKPNSDKIRYQSITSIKFTENDDLSWSKAYTKLCKQINSLGVTTLLSRDGYRYYLNLNPSNLNRYCSVYAFLFYIGTIARYRPSLNESVLKGIFQAIINEAIETCPNQLYYHLVSLITKRVCAIPMAKI